jgi:DNA-binding MarR family transcriptional regulator
MNNSGKKIPFDTEEKYMETIKTDANPLNDNDFKLWALLDHTRFIIFRSREIELAKVNLTPEQARILYILCFRGGSTTINELMTVTQRQHHSISTLISRMVKQGLVNKTIIPNAKGKYDVTITEKGREIYARINIESIRETFACLTDEKKLELESRLKELHDSAYAALRKNMNAKYNQPE